MSLTKMQLSRLLETYGGLLTDKQREIVTMYCDCDCTLSEIAEEKEITRQSVRDAILKATDTFEKLESCLHLAEFVQNVNIEIQSCDDCKIVELTKKFVEKE